MSKSYYRGREIRKTKSNTWIYSDTKTPVKLSKIRSCGYCNQFPTKEGHDACIGILNNVMNACCGHGKDDEAYIQFLNGVCIRGKEALIIIKKRSKINAC